MKIEELRLLLLRLSRAEKERLADKIGTSVQYLQQISGGHRKASVNMAVSIECATKGVITREVLRPDIFTRPVLYGRRKGDVA